jgi:predicted metal-dependent RNase
VIWDDLYKSIAKALLKRGVVRDDSVVLASGETRQQMAEALGIPASSVEAKISGK